MSGKVIVVGSYNQDHVWQMERFPQPGETLRGTGFVSGAGGKGFNQAVACARQGVDTVFVAAHGDDALGTVAARNALDARLDCRWQILDEYATGSAAIMVDASSQNQIVVTLGANQQLAPDFVRNQGAAFAAAQILLTQMETSIAAVFAALDMATQSGMLRILNPAPVDPAINRELLTQCDLITPNESEFCLLLERIGEAAVDAAEVASMDDLLLHGLCRKLAVPCVIITLGRHGCFVSHGDECNQLCEPEPYYRLAAEQVHAIDTTGAGDAFNGALVAALLRWPKQPVRKSVTHANRAAALSTEQVGAAASMVDFDAVVERFGEA